MDIADARLSPGAAAAVTTLYAEHALGLVRLAVVLTGDRGAAEDIAQDAFLGLYRRWDSLADTAAPLGYLRVSVVNGCRTALRRRSRLRLGTTADFAEEAAEAGGPASYGGGPSLAESAEARALLGDEQRTVAAALRKLPRRQREAVVLRCYLDLSELETAQAMGVSRGTVKSATGHPLLAWSTKTAPAMWSADSGQEKLLTWIDSDRAITFSGLDVARGTENVRRLSFPMLPGHGDLIADSQLIWSTSASNQPSCTLTPPVVSANGKAIACAAFGIGQPSAGYEQWTSSWRVYRTSAQAPAAGKYAIAYQVTLQSLANIVTLSDTLWVSPSGSAVVGAWATAPLPVVTPSHGTDGNGTGVSEMLLVGGALRGATVHAGVMSHGTFTPLRLPQDIFSLPAYAVAW